MKKLYLFFIIVSVIFLAGCFNKKSAVDNRIEKNIKQTYEERGENVDVNIDTEKGELTFENKDQGVLVKTSEQGDLELPDDWPKEVKVYPNGKLVAVVKNDEGMHITIKVDDGLDKIKKWYDEQMQKTDWQSEMNFNMGASWMSSYKKGNYQLVFNAGPSEEESGNMLTISYIQAK